MRKLITIGLCSLTISLGVACIPDTSSSGDDSGEDTRKDAGPGNDSGPGNDATNPECKELDERCDDDCCEGLYCDADGFCSPEASCSEDRSSDPAGTDVASAVELSTVADGSTVLHGCTGAEYRDFFFLNAQVDDVIKIQMSISGSAPDGANDLDVFLYINGGPGTATDCDTAFISSLGCPVAYGATTSAVEQVYYPVAMAGKYYVVVEGYDGGESDYTLSYEIGKVCAVDSDCSGASAYCHMDVMVDAYGAYLTQECVDWTVPSCGQDSPEDASDSHSMTTAASFTAVATDGVLNGTTCAGDPDVFSVSITDPKDIFIANFESPQMPSNSVAYIVLSDAEGQMLTNAVLYNYPDGQQLETPLQASGLEAGTYYIYLNYKPDAGGTGEMDYTMTVTNLKGCRLDADCQGGDFCYTGFIEGSLSVGQYCRTWTLPTCGQDGPEDATDNHSDTSAVTFSSVATEGTLAGKICGDDIDVLTVDVAAIGTSLVGNLESSGIGNEKALIAVLTDADGEYIDMWATYRSQGEEALESLILGSNLRTTGTHRLYLSYVSLDDTAAGNLDYNIGLQTNAGCRTDADCAEGSVCNLMLAGTGPMQMCAPYKADACDGGSDDDNSFTNATAVTLDESIAASACPTNGDFYKVTLTEARSDLTATLTWSEGHDFDLYGFLADGTEMGASWYGDGTEAISGLALPAGTYYFVVDLWAYSNDALDGTASKDYSFVVTATTGAACDANDYTTCRTGGADPDNDPAYYLSCESGTCKRPIDASLFTVAAGDECFDSTDCASPVCVFSTCTGECSSRGQDLCDDLFGVDQAYCLVGVWDGFAPCVPSCGSGYPWTADDCKEYFGEDSGCDTETHQCILPF